MLRGAISRRAAPPRACQTPPARRLSPPPPAVRPCLPLLGPQATENPEQYYDYAYGGEEEEEAEDDDSDDPDYGSEGKKGGKKKGARQAQAGGRRHEGSCGRFLLHAIVALQRGALTN